MGDEDIEQLVEYAATSNSPLARQRLFRSIRFVEVFFPHKVEDRGGKEVRSTPLARLADGTHAMMLFTSKSHPTLAEHDRCAGGAFQDALAAALKMPRLDWVLLWNCASHRVAIAKEQIPEILADIGSISAGDQGGVTNMGSDRSEEALEDIITRAARSESEELPAAIGAVIGDREVFLELSKNDSQDGQPAMITFQIEHLRDVVRVYTTRVRPGIRYGGIKWEPLKQMIRGVPEISGVQIVNDADDWILFDREALGLETSAES